MKPIEPLNSLIAFIAAFFGFGVLLLPLVSRAADTVVLDCPNLGRAGMTFVIHMDSATVTRTYPGGPDVTVSARITPDHVIFENKEVWGVQTNDIDRNTGYWKGTQY